MHSPCGEETVNGNDNERLQNGKSCMNQTESGGWQCLIQHLDSIYQFLIDDHFCCGGNGG